MSRFERTELLIGKEKIDILRKKKVAVFGLGGVGGYACEALARSGVGELHLIDNDIVDETNINRQIIALKSTIGRDKVDVMKERIFDIGDDIRVFTYKVFLTSDNIDTLPFDKFDYVVDAIDTISAKVALIEKAEGNNIPIISAMGTGNKLYAEKLKIADIYDTKVCPLAKTIRTELKKRDIKKLKVVYSEELPKNEISDEEKTDNYKNHKRVISSISYVPAVAGLLMAEEVIKDLIV